MNEKIRAILLKMVVKLKKENWKLDPNWELTLKSDGHIMLKKVVHVEDYMDDKSIEDNIDINITLELTTADEITYFPKYILYANIFVDGGDNKDIATPIEIDVAFTEQDVSNDEKIQTAVTRITRRTTDRMENEFSDYIAENKEAIKMFRMGGGWKEDFEEN